MVAIIAADNSSGKHCGTGVVPDETFTLAENDEVTIQISGIGTLKNRVTIV